VNNVYSHIYIFEYFVPSGVRALPLAAGINEVGHYFRYFSPSGVRALPLAQGLAILGLESRDRDHYKLIVSLVVETETETLLSSVLISRPRPRLNIILTIEM
jgi:hypothetical protein